MSVFFVYLIKKFGEKNQLFDVPNDRSSHVIPTPNAGGVGFVFAFIIGAGLLLKGQGSYELFLFLFPVIFLFFVGILDDFFSLSPAVRFFIQTLCAILVVYLGEFSLRWLGLYTMHVAFPHWIGASLAVIFIVAMTNIYNFMDGLDGYAAGNSIITASSFYMAFSMFFLHKFALIQMILIFSLLGFLVWNFPKAKIFMGDSGSLFLGFYFASMSLFLIKQHPEIPILLPMSWSAIFIMDASVTLFIRLVRKRRIWEAHRDHFYQKLNRSGWSHKRIIWLEYSHSILVCLASFLFFKTGEIGHVFLFTAIVLSCLLKFYWIRLFFLKKMSLKY